MTNNRTYIALLFCLSITYSISAQVLTSERIYFNEKWEICEKENAAYYRDFGKEVSPGLWEARDYFIDGRLQFEAYSSVRSEPLHKERTAIWYNEAGDTTGIVDFVNDEPKGRVVNFYPNKKRMTEYVVADGENDGPGTSYFPWGGKREVMNTKNGEFVGWQRQFDLTGTLRAEDFYDDNYELLIQRKYFREGAIWQNIEMTDSKTGLYEQFYENGQKRSYIKQTNSLIDGYVYEWTKNGDTTLKAFYSGRFPQSCYHSFERFGSRFEKRMERQKGKEYWKVYRDSILVLQGWYEDDYRSAYKTTWTMYTIDGTQKLMTYTFNDFDEELEMLSQYDLRDELNTVKGLFQPGWRFRISQTSRKAGEVEHHILENASDIHPFKKRYDEDNSPSLLEILGGGVLKIDSVGDKEVGTIHRTLKDSFDYTDPSIRDSFTQKNNAKLVIINEQEVVHFQRKFGNVIIYFYAAQDVDVLKKIRKDADPKDNEFYFFYQQFESKVYPKNTRTMDRWMGWKITPSVAYSIENKVLKSMDVVQILEHDIFFVDDFSGISADTALERHVEELINEM